MSRYKRPDVITIIGLSLEMERGEPDREGAGEEKLLEYIDIRLARVPFVEFCSYAFYSFCDRIPSRKFDISELTPLWKRRSPGNKSYRPVDNE